jgi:hypothetical protein
MGPKKAKKSKAELEEERLAREEEERKLKAAEEKRLAEEREKKRQEELKLQAELKAHREKQFARLQEEYVEIADEKKSKLQQLEAEERKEVSPPTRSRAIGDLCIALYVILFSFLGTAKRMGSI